MEDTLFVLRPARVNDIALINLYAYREGMDDIPGIEGVTVAVNGEDEPVGFIRIKQCDNSAAHINPVVVYRPWRGFGVGRALVEDALAREGELRLVSRGSSYAFYRALGFEDASWDGIDPEIASECEGCELAEECQPMPMRRVLASAE